MKIPNLAHTHMIYPIKRQRQPMQQGTEVAESNFAALVPEITSCDQEVVPLGRTAHLTGVENEFRPCQADPERTIPAFPFSCFDT